jgi:hypothetical protein
MFFIIRLFLLFVFIYFSLKVIKTIFFIYQRVKQMLKHSSPSRESAQQNYEIIDICPKCGETKSCRC